MESSAVAPVDLGNGTSHAVRIRAGALSLVVAVLLLGAKYYAFTLTGSAAILSDALESIVNVAAAAVALGALVVASWPADRNHPYGHGKVEFMTAAFEGGLIAFAALLIISEAVQTLIRGADVRDIDVGLAITAGAAAVNYALGWYLIRTGRRHVSLALLADGRHVQTDFWTSAGVVAGLLLVMITDQEWIDPVVAIVVGLNLAVAGWRLVREAAGGLLDEEDPALLREIVDALDANRVPGVIRVHFLRAIRSGNFRHVDAHLVVPEYWPVERAHELADDLEAKVTEAVSGESEIAFHMDPCRQMYCRQCEVLECPIRLEPFESKPPFVFEEAIRAERRESRVGNREPGTGNREPATGNREPCS